MEWEKDCMFYPIANSLDRNDLMLSHIENLLTKQIDKSW